MARLKFMRDQESGAGYRQLVVEVSDYEIVPRLNGQTDVQYCRHPGEVQTVEVSNRKHPNCYPVCYIESEATGKTVEILRARDRSAVTEAQAAEA